MKFVVAQETKVLGTKMAKNLEVIEAVTLDEAKEIYMTKFPKATNVYGYQKDEETTTTNNKEEETMKTTNSNEFTTPDGTIYGANDAGTYYYKIVNGKKTRISYQAYCDATSEVPYEEPTAEDAQAELDKEPCRVEVNSDLYKPAVFRKDCPGCVDCSDCNVTGCVHRDCMRRNPRSEGGLGECPRLDVKPQQEEPDEAQDPELEQIMEETGLEPADAELERNVRNEQKKPARKPRKSKDIAYEGHGKTLTAKQVDFILHLSDTCFWENGLESTPWIDVLCDEIGGQFAGKPMTVGAMVSTLCEKGLGYRAVDSLTDMVTGRGRKATYFALTDLGKEIAKELGLE